MEAVNSTSEIMHVYTTLTTLWKYFHNSPKRAVSLKEIQKVIKSSDTYWFAHKLGIKAVKLSYTALVFTLDSDYQNFHAPEALGLYKTLCKFTTIAVIYLQDYTLPLVAKLSKSLQTKQLDLSMISSPIDAVLHALDDANTPAVYWVVKLL